MTQPQRPPTEPRLSLEEGRTLFMVTTCHLDTQWRWTVQDTIRRFLPRTLRQNFELFERFPGYVLSFEGAFRYMLIREYFPDDWERLKRWAAAGRWHPAGSMLDAADVNVVSPESLIRHVLYASRFFRRELGLRSGDLFLPDNFGFGFALPTIAAHCGLEGFSAQKFIRWMAPAEPPFEIGLWEGPDGSTVVAAIRPGGYGEPIRTDPGRDPEWIERIDRLGSETGLYVGYRYFGASGDRGGGPDAASLELLETARRGPGPIRVVPAASDRLFRELSASQVKRLPRHRGELLLPTHGTGCLTAAAAMKRWNRKNELLADAAERAAVAADWLGGAAYPRDKLAAGWLRFLWHQMHDDLTGTSIPPAYRFSWNDEVVALNTFAAVLCDAAGAVSKGLDTRVPGRPVVVFNPLSIEREDVAIARLDWPGVPPPAVRVHDPEGREVPSQSGAQGDGWSEVLFLARLPSVGFAVYDVRPADSPCGIDTGLRVERTVVEGPRYRAEVDASGDLARLLDRTQDRQLLRAPASLQLLPDRSRRWPAWEILFEDIVAEPREVVGGPPRLRVIESGPVRVALEIRRRSRGSVFTQLLRLSAGGAGARLEVDTTVDWATRGRLLKAVFPLTVSSAEATYDLGLGTIRRGNHRREKYEVPAQQWADLTDDDGTLGVSILNDCKYGWDKPDNSTLRLTLLRSPATRRRFRHQARQDFGRHRFLYAISSHPGDWRAGGTVWQAARVNQPLRTFQTTRHPGELGRVFSLLRVSSERVAVAAIKQAEDSEEIVVRVRETVGEPAPRVALTFAGEVVATREIDGTEDPVGPATIGGGELVTELGPYQPRAFAVRLAAPPARCQAPAGLPLTLPYDLQAASFHGHLPRGDFDGRGRTLPGELLPDTVTSEGIRFALGPRGPGQNNAVSCRGQRLPLPPGGWERLYLLAGAVRGDTRAIFAIDGSPAPLTIHHYSGEIGRWPKRHRLGSRTRGLLKRQVIAWLGTHRHDARGHDEPYVFCYLFRYRIDLPPAAASLRLPDRPWIRLLAATLVTAPNDATTPAEDLYD